MSNQQLRLYICFWRKEDYIYTNRIILDFDKVYQSNSYGKFKIIEDMGRDCRSRRLVKIKFLDTGTEKVVRYDLAMAGRVSDELYGIDFEKIYDSYYYGKYKIISFVGRTNDSKKIVRIRFLNTNFEYDVLLRQALNGKVKDYTVNYHDRLLPKDNYGEFIKKCLIDKWWAMMNRCYNKNSASYHNYGGIGVSVSQEWQNQDMFLETIVTVPNFYKYYYNPDRYQLDKDYLQLHIPKEQRIYSKETCVFLNEIDNANLSMLENSKDKIYGIRCINNNLYSVQFSIKGKKQSFGTYSNIIAAANEYNYYYVNNVEYEYVPLINTTFPYMSHKEAQKYLVSKKQI